MLNEMLGLLPEAINRVPAGILLAIGVGGLLLALSGARFSRQILALSLVAAGTIVGLRCPRWFGWGIDPMGTAFGAAIILGLSGYLLTRTWEGILLGALFATVFGAAAWLTLAAGQTWTLPQIDWSASSVETLARIWQSLPPAVNRAFPLALGAGVTLGILTAALWPRMGRVLLYSIAGIALFVLAGTVGLQREHSSWLAYIPANSATRAEAIAGMLLVAMLVQWLLLPRSKHIEPSEDCEEDFVADQVKAPAFEEEDEDDLPWPAPRAKPSPARPTTPRRQVARTSG